MVRKLNKRAQTTAEYAILIAIVVGAVVAMQIYVRRGLQGRIRNVVDHVGQGGAVGGGNFAFTAGMGGQYEPYYLASQTDASSGRQEQEVYGEKGQVGRQAAEVSRQARTSKNAWDNAAVTTSGIDQFNMATVGGDVTDNAVTTARGAATATQALPAVRRETVRQ